MNDRLPHLLDLIDLVDLRRCTIASRFWLQPRTLVSSARFSAAAKLRNEPVQRQRQPDASNFPGTARAPVGV